MSVGTEDPHLPYQKQALEDFQKHGIQPIFKTYPGVHESKVWRHSLAEFAPLLFGKGHVGWYGQNGTLLS